jgi:hypothetical protein
MLAAIQELEEKRKYLLGRIEYLEATLEKIKFNEGELDEDFCTEQIDLHEHTLAGYRTELQQIESKLAAESD